MKRLFILTTFLLGISPICLNAQELTLEECQQQAQAHYPLIKRYGLIEKTKEYNISNAGKGYLPQVSLSAKASYQSDVTEIPVDLPGILIFAAYARINTKLCCNWTKWYGTVVTSGHGKR